VVLPLLDILQSIPVLGFLPGLLLGLVALFPNTNTGLELAAIIMIFTGQVWNMTFSYYSSLKSIPTEFQEAATVIGLNWHEKLIKLELPFSAVNLAWNSLMSMAGGWFFLIPCEAMTLGDREYRLPGIGAYMDVAIKKGDHRAISLAIVAMILLIVSMDFVIWRPILAWVHRFRLEDVAGVAPVEPVMQIWFRESKIVRSIKLFYHHWIAKNRNRKSGDSLQDARVEDYVKNKAPSVYQAGHQFYKKLQIITMSRTFRGLVITAVSGFILYGAFNLFTVLMRLPLSSWIILLRNSLWTMLRVLLAVGLSTLWAVPVGIWLGTSPKRIRIAQPIIQIFASFPAPMLYPLLLGFLLNLGISFDFGSMLLMLLGVQWYVLFNVLSGALRIPHALNEALSLMETSRWDRWRTLYLPSVFPSLTTGWVTAAGGAWNASVVAEYIYYKGEILKTGGLGATLSEAIAREDFTLFAASLTLMVLVVILLNRTVWSRVYQLAQTRFRMDL
jgi:NitT/TauT family transport system permease protein